MNKLLIFVLLLAVCRSALAEVSSVEASVNKNPVMVDEAIQLTVEAEGNPERDAFDSSSLLNDFVVGRTSVSTQTQIINLGTRQSTTWTTTLFPRGEGTFTIPSFNIEGKTTNPITVKVIPVKSGSEQPARDYYVTTEVDTASVYLHQQLLYTVKLYLATGIERGSLQAPELKNAQIQQLGDDKQYTDIVNGKRYQIIERNFAIVPQESGNFSIKGPVFTGEVVAPDANSRFGFFNQTRSINRLGPDIDINVNPIPSGIDYPWLPSEYVSIHDEWPQQQNFTVGEPVTRTITLTAMGVVEEMLPELPENYPPGFKLYPDQANTATVNKDNTLVAQRVESVAVIPTQAGQFVLPEISVPWFNVLTGETEYATLPAKSITVAPAKAGTSTTAGTPPMKALPPVDKQEAASTPAVTSPINSSAGSQNTMNWLVWTVVGLWILTIVGWISSVFYLRRRAIGSLEKPTISTDSDNEKQVFSDLCQAVKQGSSAEVQRTFKIWLQCLYPQANAMSRADSFSTTAGVQPHFDAMLSSQYGSQPGSWDRKGMLEALIHARQQALSQHDKKSALPGLYSGGSAPT